MKMRIALRSAKLALDLAYAEFRDVVLAYEAEPNPYTARAVREAAQKLCRLGFLDGAAIRRINDQTDS